jgi:hypothetical protein
MEISPARQDELMQTSKAAADRHYQHVAQELDTQGVIHSSPIQAPPSPVPQSSVPLGQLFESLNVCGKFQLIVHIVI